MVYLDQDIMYVEAVAQGVPVLRSSPIIMTKDKREASSEVSGVSNKVLATVEGKKVMIKSDGCERETYAEYIGYRLGTAIGFNVNKVDLVDCGDLLGLKPFASVHYWEDNFYTMGQLKNMGDINHDRESELKLGVKFFDAIIDNEDRHGYNWGLVGQEVFLIDNGMSYINRTWDESEAENDIITALTSEEAKQYVYTFANLKVQEIKDLLRMPENLNHGLSEEFFENVEKRIFSAQTTTRNLILSHGGYATWLM